MAISHSKERLQVLASFNGDLQIEQTMQQIRDKMGIAGDFSYTIDSLKFDGALKWRWTDATQFPRPRLYSLTEDGAAEWRTLSQQPEVLETLGVKQP